MNKYERIYKKASSRANGSNASWLDAAIAPLALDIEERTGEETTIGGPLGLRAEVYIETKSRVIIITPNFEDGEFKLYYDTGDKKGLFKPNTLGGINGFDNVHERLPEKLDEIIEVMQKRHGGTENE